jgi:hypothetical protein
VKCSLPTMRCAAGAASPLSPCAGLSHTCCARGQSCRSRTSDGAEVLRGSAPRSRGRRVCSATRARAELGVSEESLPPPEVKSFSRRALRRIQREGPQESDLRDEVGRIVKECLPRACTACPSTCARVRLQSSFPRRGKHSQRNLLDTQPPQTRVHPTGAVSASSRSVSSYLACATATPWTCRFGATATRMCTGHRRRSTRRSQASGLW